MAETGSTVETPTTTEDDKFTRLLEVLAAQKSGGIDLEALRTLLQETAQASAGAMQKAMKPENATHPGISVFSYPEGDVARPRPVLPYEFFWNNYPCHKFPETEHWRELELMCEVKPGEYTVLRTDLTPMKVEVKAERNADGKITKLAVEFPVSHAEKNLVPPKVVLLYQLIHAGENPRQTFMAGMQEYFGVVAA